MLDEAHVAPLTVFVRCLHEQRGGDASILMLFEGPGRRATSGTQVVVTAPSTSDRAFPMLTVLRRLSAQPRNSNHQTMRREVKPSRPARLVTVPGV